MEAIETIETHCIPRWWWVADGEDVCQIPGELVTSWAPWLVAAFFEGWNTAQLYHKDPCETINMMECL